MPNLSKESSPLHGPTPEEITAANSRGSSRSLIRRLPGSRALRSVTLATVIGLGGFAALHQPAEACDDPNVQPDRYGYCPRVNPTTAPLSGPVYGVTTQTGDGELTVDVFADRNSDGVRQTGEPGLSADIAVIYQNGSANTRTSGYGVRMTLQAGLKRVCAALAEGYNRFTTNGGQQCVDVIIPAGGAVTASIGETNVPGYLVLPIPTVPTAAGGELPGPRTRDIDPHKPATPPAKETPTPVPAAPARKSEAPKATPTPIVCPDKSQLPEAFQKKDYVPLLAGLIRRAEDTKCEIKGLEEAIAKLTVLEKQQLELLIKKDLTGDGKIGPVDKDGKELGPSIPDQFEQQKKDIDALIRAYFDKSREFGGKDWVLPAAILGGSMIVGGALAAGYWRRRRPPVYVEDRSPDGQRIWRPFVPRRPQPVMGPSGEILGYRLPEQTPAHADQTHQAPNPEAIIAFGGNQVLRRDDKVTINGKLGSVSRVYIWEHNGDPYRLYDITWNQPEPSGETLTSYDEGELRAMAGSVRVTQRASEQAAKVGQMIGDAVVVEVDRRDNYVVQHQGLPEETWTRQQVVDAIAANVAAAPADEAQEQGRFNDEQIKLFARVFETLERVFTAIDGMTDDELRIKASALSREQLGAIIQAVIFLSSEEDEEEIENLPAYMLIRRLSEKRRGINPADAAKIARVRQQLVQNR